MAWFEVLGNEEEKLVGQTVERHNVVFVKLEFELWLRKEVPECE